MYHSTLGSRVIKKILEALNSRLVVRLPLIVKEMTESHPRLVVVWLPEREFVIDKLLVRIHFIIVMIKWTGLAPWEFEFPLAG